MIPLNVVFYAYSVLRNRIPERRCHCLTLQLIPSRVPEVLFQLSWRRHPKHSQRVLSPQLQDSTQPIVQYAVINFPFFIFPIK